MADGDYVFSGSQSAFLDALKDGRYRGSELTDFGRKRVSLQDRMPPVYQQALRGTCVANAATALLEYYEDRKVRLSVQFLYEMTKTVERRWLDANLKALGENRDVDAEFAAKFPAQVAQVRLTTDANGVGSPAAKAFLSAFARQLGEYFNDGAGSQVKRCFEAIREYGTCRYSLWPYANMQAADPTAGGSLPPGSLEDAAKHRVLSGLYLLRSPNNVDEIRGIVAGANGRRPMPVCVGLPLFEGCDGTDFRFPEGVESGDRLISRNAFKGVHEMLIVGFEADRTVAGGGWFAVRNSWGEDWGKDGYGRVPYAYVECFCTEAGTILQDMVDYVGDGYGAKAACPVASALGQVTKERKLGCVLGFGGLTVSASVLAVLAVVFVVPEMMRRETVPAHGEKTLLKPEAAVSRSVPDEANAGHLREAEAKRLAEENRQAEAKRLAEERQLAEEKSRLAEERRRLAEERRQAEEKRLAEEMRQAEARRQAEDQKRLAEEKRLAEARKALEEEKARLEQARRAVEARAAAEAEAARAAAAKAQEEAKRRDEATRLAAEAKRQAEEAEKIRLAEQKAAEERAKIRDYLIHVTLTCMNENERDAVILCLGELSGSGSGGRTNTVDNVTSAECATGRNLIGFAKKGYQIRCDLRMRGDIRMPTDEAKRVLSQALNERCQFEGEDRIDWSSFRRIICSQDFSTANGRLDAPKNSTTGVRTGF